MNRSLYSKLVFIMLLLIVALMVVVGAFMTRGIRNFYLNDFYEKMESVFSGVDLAADLRTAADDTDAADKMADILWAYSGRLGIDSGTRNYYILDGTTGSVLAGSDTGSRRVEITPNILTALTGESGYGNDSSEGYMDVAIPVEGESGSYIIYIKDNKETVQGLNDELLRIMLIAMLIGLAIAVMLNLLLAKTMVTPLQSLTKAAEKVASGDFSDKLDIRAKDEIGVLANTFNDMADQLENTLDDLKKSEMMRREFVANVSHELRTPITSVRSYAETLNDNDDIPKDMEREFLHVIMHESDRMTKIVQDLLTLSRFDAGSIEFTFEYFQFGKSVEDVYNAMLLEAQRHNHSFKLEMRSGIPEIRGDRARIEQVLINMVSNAIKYTHDGGNIRIVCDADKDMVWVSVRDNGIGIPKEDVDRVFERFYRVDKARSRESGGTGLGLSIAQEIVARHDGGIQIQSQLGKGTTITVTLPVGGPKNE